MPRSRSRSIESSSCSRISRAETASVISRMRSASVDLPWSMWAMIEKLRILLWSMGVRRWYSDGGFFPGSRSRSAAGCGVGGLGCDGLLDRIVDGVGVGAFRKVENGAEPDRMLGDDRRREATEDDDARIGSNAPELGEGLESCSVRHREIEQNDVGLE